MPADKLEKREKGKSHGESSAHNRKDCLEKSIEQVKYSAALPARPVFSSSPAIRQPPDSKEKVTGKIFLVEEEKD
jgi:hypothetical protein